MAVPPLCARLDAALAVGDEADAQQADAEKGERGRFGDFPSLRSSPLNTPPPSRS